MKYSKNIREYAKVRMEQNPNNTHVAKELKLMFKLPQDLDSVRKIVSMWRKNLLIKAKSLPIKRLFFDIETSYYVLKINTWQLRSNLKYFDHNDIIREKEIICISYKWQYENEVHTLDWRNGEKSMLKDFIKVLGDADEIVAHNGDKFDIKFLRTRCLFNRVLMFPTYRTLDTLLKARGRFLFASNRLDYLGKFMGAGGKEEHEGMKMWTEIVENQSQEYLDKMIAYNKRDVALLEDVFTVMSPYMDHNNNFAVLTGGEKWHCPACASGNVKMYRTYSTPMGTIRRNMKCNSCKKQYKISNKTYLHMLHSLTKED